MESIHIQSSKKICFVFGTRPEIIKLAPLIKLAEQSQIPYLTIHTGQHYSPDMDSVFFENLKLPPPHYNLSIGSGSHANQTGAALSGIEALLFEHTPDWVVVQGDTNSVLAGALAASKLQIPVAHVEAGLRSYDRAMPEEVNRVVTGVLAIRHFVPTEVARDNLLREGVHPETIHVVGNTIVDAVIENVELAKEYSSCLKEHKLDTKKYHLVTIHRPENTDSDVPMQAIVMALKGLYEKDGLKQIWPIHPRTKKQLNNYDLWPIIEQNRGLKIIDPVDYFDMLQLVQNCDVTITDSGGIQEESCILQVPCVTVRKNTERPESIEVGANRLVKSDAEEILSAVELAKKSIRIWKNPFGDGNTSKRIFAELTK